MKVALYALLVFAIGAYCNCGCLNCNKQFHVISPPGSRVQIIHRKIHHCTCPTAIPYTVEIPVAPKVETQWARSYGYQIHPERVVVRKPHYCPIPEEYDAQLQIPEEKPQRSTYLRNLYAHTDRVIIAEPPRHHLPKVCSRPILETLGPRWRYPPAERYDSWSLRPDHKYVNMYKQIIWAPQFVVQNFLVPQITVGSKTATMSATNQSREVDYLEDTVSNVDNRTEEELVITEPPQGAEPDPEVHTNLVEMEEPKPSDQNQTMSPRENNTTVSNSENLLLGDVSSPQMLLRSTTAEITAVDHNRLRRSINYKMLGLNTKTSLLPSKSNLNFHKFTFRKNRNGLTHSPYVTGPWDRRFALRNILANRRPMLGRHRRYYGPDPHYRCKRSAKFDSSEDSNEIEAQSKSGDMFFQTAPFLKMLSFPLKVVGDLQRNPFFGEVMRVSNTIFMQFVKSFMGDYRKAKRRRRLTKREIGCDCDSRRYRRELPGHYSDNRLAYNQENALLVEILKALAHNMKKSHDYIEIGRKKRSVGEYKDIDTLSWKQLVKELEEVLRIERAPDLDQQAEERRTKRATGDVELLEEFVRAVDEPDTFLTAVKSTYNRFTRNKDDRRELFQSPPKTKREVGLLQAILKMLKAERLVPKPRATRSIGNLETQTVNEKIAQLTADLQKMITSTFHEDFDIYKKLLALQTLKVEIAKTDNVAEKIDESLRLKEDILADIAKKIGENPDEDMGKWIKTLVHLQKFHCVLKTWKKEPKDDLKEVFSKINFVNAKNNKQLLTFLKKRRAARIQRDVESVSNLKMLMASGEIDRIKKEAEFLWESNNLRKLQSDSVKEIAEKVAKKLRIRRELKILFDLQRQLELCEERQRSLLSEVEGPK